MIKKFGDYDQTKAYSDIEQLPKGGYVCKIMGVEACTNSLGDYLKIGVDIADGDYKGFFTNDYKNQNSEDKKWHCNYLLNVPKDDGSERDGWTKRRFKTFITTLEDSNAGYHFDWDESKFKNKLFGGLFNIREYENANGEIRSATNLAQVCTVEKIKDGSFKLPADKLLSKEISPAASAPSMDDFVMVPDDSSDELPFD